eukprot:2984563-Rhodomonas_salina.1
MLASVAGVVEADSEASPRLVLRGLEGAVVFLQAPSRVTFKILVLRSESTVYYKTTPSLTLTPGRSINGPSRQTTAFTKLVHVETCGCTCEDRRTDCEQARRCMMGDSCFHGETLGGDWYSMAWRLRVRVWRSERSDIASAQLPGTAGCMYCRLSEQASSQSISVGGFSQRRHRRCGICAPVFRHAEKSKAEKGGQLT